MNEDVQAYRFIYKPKKEMADLLNTLIVNFNPSGILGILLLKQVSIAKKLKLYCVGNVIDSGGKDVFYKDAMAVLARNDTEACYIYSMWNDRDGTVIGILEYDTSNLKIIPI